MEPSSKPWQGEQWRQPHPALRLPPPSVMVGAPPLRSVVQPPCVLQRTDAVRLPVRLVSRKSDGLSEDVTGGRRSLALRRPFSGQRAPMRSLPPILDPESPREKCVVAVRWNECRRCGDRMISSKAMSGQCQVGYLRRVC